MNGDAKNMNGQKMNGDAKSMNGHVKKTNVFYNGKDEDVRGASSFLEPYVAPVWARGLKCIPTHKVKVMYQYNNHKLLNFWKVW